MALLAILSISCARVPSPTRSSKLIQKHFKKYAKKYSDSVYGASGGVKEVEVLKQKEIHKNLVTVESFITLGDGQVQRIHATVQRGPFGWRFVSWENDTGM